MNFSSGVKRLRRAAGVPGELWGGVFCLGDPLSGAFIAAAGTLAMVAERPSMAVGAWAVPALARLFARLAGAAFDARTGINALLLGLAVGHAFGFGAGFSLLCVLAAAYVVPVTSALLALGGVSGIPILSLPFATGWILLQLASPSLNGLYTHAYTEYAPLCPAFDAALPAAVAAFFKNLGYLLFVPDALVGATIFTVILWRSRLLALHGALGFAFGALTLDLLAGGARPGYEHPSAFNFILTGATLGAFFLLPSPGSLVVSALGSAVAAFLAPALGAAFGKLGSTASTLPFNLTVILALAFLRRTPSPLIPSRHRGTPEETLEAERVARARFGDAPAPALPFAGPCRVYQAFDGPWTHRGRWRHAYDFVKCGEDGLTHRGQGLSLEDYHLYDLPVLSPVAGVVISFRDDLPDNLPGYIDAVNNWGNFVILCADDGSFVELSHLRRDSLLVKEGERVHVGRHLARCGNSGYSLYPHLHMQVQIGPWLGADTLPFVFERVLRGGRLYHADLPPVGVDVCVPESPPGASSPFAFVPGESLVFDWCPDGRRKTEVRWTVGRDHDAPGRFYFEDESGGTLGFAVDAGGYVAYEYRGARDTALAFFATAVPRAPNCAGGVSWRDAVPCSAVLPRALGALRVPAHALGFRTRGLSVRGVWKLAADRSRITGRIPGLPVVRVFFDERNRFVRLTAGNRRLNRKLS